MVTFKNGTAIETIAVFGSSVQFQNAQRKTLEFRIASDVATFDALKAIYTDPTALSEITISDGDTIQSLHLNYTLPVELSLKTIEDAEVFCMKVAQKSQLEIAQEQQASDISDTQLALIELGDLLAGGEE